MTVNATVERNKKVLTDFIAAFNRLDVDGVMAQMSDDCVFEHFYPAPDGARFVGAAEVRKVWEKMFADRPTGFFDEEDSFVGEERAVSRWKYKWDADSGIQYVRGVDVFRLKDGLIVEKLTYSKR